MRWTFFMGSAVQQSKEEPVLHVVDFLRGFCCTTVKRGASVTRGGFSSWVLLYNSQKRSQCYTWWIFFVGSAVQQSKEEPVLHVVDFLRGFCCTTVKRGASVTRGGFSSWVLLYNSQKRSQCYTWWIFFVGSAVQNGAMLHSGNFHQRLTLAL